MLTKNFIFLLQKLQLSFIIVVEFIFLIYFTEKEIRNMKKLLSIILSLVMIFSLATPALAESTNSSISPLDELSLTDGQSIGNANESAKEVFENLTAEQQVQFISQIETLAEYGDKSLVEFHKTYVDPDYEYNAATDLSPVQVMAAADIAGQLQALNLPSAVYYSLLAFATALGVPVGNVVDVVIGVGLAAVIVANWDAIKNVWNDIVNIFVNAFGSYVMDAFYYLQGLVGIYTVTSSGTTITINGEKYKCDTVAEDVALSMRSKGHKYYPAVRKNNNVFVAPKDIPRGAALAILKLNNSYKGVFTAQSNYASSLCNSLGGGIRGPEGEVSSGYWMHYHSKNYPKAHCWFIN